MKKIIVNYNPFTSCMEIEIDEKPISSKVLNVLEGFVIDEWVDVLAEHYPKELAALKENIKNNCIKVVFYGRKCDLEILYKTLLLEPDTNTTHISYYENEMVIDEIVELENIISNGKVEQLLVEEYKNFKDIASSSDFTVSVIATMSSGKSTLINAIIGDALLPSKNVACTATIMNIRDNDDAEEFIAEAKDKEGNVLHSMKKVTCEWLSNLNDDENVVTVDIEGDIESISSQIMNLVLVDTPGPNNSRNQIHGEITDKIISSKNKGMVMYVLNATQFGINDDQKLLNRIAHSMKMSSKEANERFIFVINKCDQLDFEKESIESLITDVKKYLSQFGIKNPRIFPVSAQTALLIRMRFSGRKLTRMENEDLLIYEDFLAYDEMHLNNYSTDGRNISYENREMLLKSSDDMLKALYYTGIPTLEDSINSYLSRQAFIINLKDYLATLNDRRLLKTFLEENELEYLLHGYCKRESIEKRGRTMGKVYIEYNPYKVETRFLINGKEISDESALHKNKNQRLQYWINKNSNLQWNGIIEELVKITNEDSLDIQFKGRRIDFEDLNLAVKVHGYGEEISLEFIEAKEDKEIELSVDKLFEKIINGNVEELKTNEIYEKFEKIKSSDFKISVLATMSSGKSTLINSFIGEELLPAKNTACTSTVTRLRDNDEAPEFTVVCKDKDENIIIEREKADLDNLINYNDEENILYMELEGRIPGISSAKMNLLLTDTPGPNNSRNLSHGNITNEIIRDKDNGVVLYVMNATQFGIKDDETLLKNIADEMKKGGKQSKDRFIFVVNKCDELDSEKESLSGLLKDVRKYLIKFEIEDPNLFPVSARTALLIRKHLNNDELSRKEKSDLRIYSEFAEYEEMFFEKYATLSDSSKVRLKEMLKESSDDYETALIHTGVPALEVAIDEYLEKYAYPIKVKEMMTVFSDIVEHEVMYNNLDALIANDTEAYERLKLEIRNLKEKGGIKELVENLIERISKFDIDKEIFKKINMKMLNKLEKITTGIRSNDKMSEEEAKFVLEEFKTEIRNLENALKGDLDRGIRNNIYKEGEKLLAEYNEYLENVDKTANISGFKFNKNVDMKKLEFKNTTQFLDNYSKEVDIIKTVEVINKDKKWFKPWTWKDARTSNVERVVGTRIEVDMNQVIDSYMGEIRINFSKNIKLSENKSEEEVENLKMYFKYEIHKAFELFKKIADNLEKKTMNEDEIQKRVEENKEAKEWLDAIKVEIAEIWSV